MPWIIDLMTNVERVLALINSSSCGVTDREIRERTGISPHQQVNQICNRLARDGRTRRELGPQGLLVNKPTEQDETIPPVLVSASRKEQYDVVLGLPEIDLDRTLLVIPCSGRKRDGGVEPTNSVSILDFLPLELSAELSDYRKHNARDCHVDESRRMAAVERYRGTLYETAEGTFERLCRSAAAVTIVSGGYGVVLALEQIGWYEQRFNPAMWPGDLVPRCLAAFAEVIDARAVVGFFGASTPYAKVFRRVNWPSKITDAWLVAPAARGGGALVKVPRAIGEALVMIESTGTLANDWTSSDDLPIRILRTAGAGARQPKAD